LSLKVLLLLCLAVQKLTWPILRTFSDQSNHSGEFARKLCRFGCCNTPRLITAATIDLIGSVCTYFPSWMALSWNFVQICDW
jgi:hypothetical protein